MSTSDGSSTNTGMSSSKSSRSVSATFAAYSFTRRSVRFSPRGSLMRQVRPKRCHVSVRTGGASSRHVGIG